MLSTTSTSMSTWYIIHIFQSTSSEVLNVFSFKKGQKYCQCAVEKTEPRVYYTEPQCLLCESHHYSQCTLLIGIITSKFMKVNYLEYFSETITFSFTRHLFSTKSLTLITKLHVVINLHKNITKIFFLFFKLKLHVIISCSN